MADSGNERGEESLYVNVESVSQVDKPTDSMDDRQTMSTNKAVPTLAELMSLLEGAQTEASSNEGEEVELPSDRPVRGIRSLQVVLKGGGPWGFTLCGGDDLRSPLRVAEIESGGRADTEGSLLPGDCISRVNDLGCSTITEAVQLIQSAFRTLTLQVLRGHVEQSGNTPPYLRRAREEQDKAIAPQDDSIMYRESKHSLQSGAMKMKARQKPSRGESFCVGSSGAEKPVVGSSRASLSPRHAARNYENLLSKSPVDGNRSAARHRGLLNSRAVYKHLSQENLVDRSLRESSHVIPNSLGGKSGPLSPAKSTPALNKATMEDVVSSRYLSHSKSGFYSAKSSPNINQELDVSVLGEPPKLVRPSFYADKQLNRSGIRYPQKSVWERDKDSSKSIQQHSPRDKNFRLSPSPSQSLHRTKDSQQGTYHADTSFQPITDKDAENNRQSVPYRRNYKGHDYHNLDYSAPYKHGAGYEPSDSGSDSELEDPPAIPPPPHPATLLNPGHYPPCSPPAPPIRDLATIKVCSVNQSHEKYPSWPVTTPNVRATAQQSQPITSRAESWNDHTNTSSEFPRKQRIACLPFQPNLRPLTEKNGSDGKSRNSSDPGLKSNVMHQATVAKIDDISEDGIKNFYNSMYPPPKYDSDGHNLGDKEYSVPSPPERDIPVTTNKLPPSNLASPTPKQYNVQRSDHPQPSPLNNLPTDITKNQGTSPLQSPRDETQSRAISSQSVSTNTRRQSVDRSAEGNGSGHYPPKHVDSRGYIVTPRPYYNTGTQTEVNSHEAPQSNYHLKKPDKIDKRHAEVQVNDMASQTSPKRPDSLSDQWASGGKRPSDTMSAWQNSESINGLDQIKGIESPTRRKSESWNRSNSSGNIDVRETRGRRSEVIPPSFHKDQKYKNVQENKSLSENVHRDSSGAPPANTHKPEESRDSNLKDNKKYDGAINYSHERRNNPYNIDPKRDRHSANNERVRDLESSDDFMPSMRSKYDRRSEPPLPYSGSRINSDVLEDDNLSKSDGSESSVPSFHEYTPSTAPLLRMLSKEMYGQQFSTRPHYQHDKNLSFSSQENSSRSIGSPTPSSQYGNLKEAESYSSVLIYSDASSGPLGRDDFGSQQSLGSQISLLPEGKSTDYNKDLYLDKNIPSDDLSPRELVRAMRNKYSFDNTSQAFKQANNPIHKYSGSESGALNYSHNYVNTYDIDGSERNSNTPAMSPRSGKSISSPSAVDKRSTLPQTMSTSVLPTGQPDSRQVSHKKQRSSGSSIDLSNQSSPGPRLSSKSSEDLRLRTPSTKTERQPPLRSQSSKNLPYKKHSSSGSSSDQSLASPLSRSEQLQIMEPQQKIRSPVSSETAKIAPIRQLSREDLGDSVFTEDLVVTSVNSDKPPQGRKRGSEKIVTRQESMKRAMGTFDEGEQTLYTTTHLSKTSKSWNNLQDAQKTNLSKAPPRSQSYSNYQGMHSNRSQSESNRLEQIQETSESPESKTSGVSRGSSYPNLSQLQRSKQKREPKTYNPKMWEDDRVVNSNSPNKSSSLKRTTSEQVRSKLPNQSDTQSIVISKPPSSSSDRKISLDNHTRNSEQDSRKLHQQALNYVDRKKGRSVGSNSSHSSDGGSVSSPPFQSKWPSNSSETMVKQIHRSESFSESTVSGDSDSRRHSTSSIQSQKDERLNDSNSTNKKDPLVKSSAGPAPSFAQEERVNPAVRLEATTGALAPRPYKRPSEGVPLNSPEDEAPPALPPRNYRKFDGEPPLMQTNNLRRFSTEGRLDQTSRRSSTEGQLDQTPVRKLIAEGTKERFDSPREDAYVDRLRLASRRLSEHVMPNPARINLINSKPASYISHSVATQPTVPQEATGIPLSQNSSPVPGSPTAEDKSILSEKASSVSEPDQTKDMFLTTLKIVEEKDEKERTRTPSPESSPDIPLPSPPRNIEEEITDEEFPPPPDFLTEIEQAHDTKEHPDDQQDLDNNRYPDGSYGSHKNNRSGARPFGSYQRSSSGPFNEPSDESDTVSQERPKRLGERAWRSVQSLPPQAASPTGTPSPDSRSARWLSYRQPTGSMSPVNTLPRNAPHRRASDNFQATAMKSSASFNTTVTLMSSRTAGSREHLTNGQTDNTSPSVRDRVSNFERSKYSERLNNSANIQSSPVNSDNNDTSVKTKDVPKPSENLANSTNISESGPLYNSRSADINRNNTRVSDNKPQSGINRTANLQTPPSHSNSANNKRISLDNSVANKGRLSDTSSPSNSSPSVNRPETLVIIHRREKSKEEEECDRQAKLLAGQLDDSGLSQVISPPFEMRSAMDYMNGLFEATSPSVSVNRSNSSVTRQDVHVSPKPTDKSVNSNTSSPSNKTSESPIPANSPYWISPAKAKLIERMRESNEFKLGDDDGNIEQKKEELMERINKKLEVLQRARDDVQQDIDANNLLGKQITKTVNEKCKDQEKEKYKSFIEGLEKIVRLMLKLSGLLARAENALSCLSPDADQQQRNVLVEKRDNLLERHEEANRLKADIDKRRNVVAGILQNNLNEEEIGDYMHFVDMKSRLTIELQELEDKITLGQEQLQALKRSMLDEK